MPGNDRYSVSSVATSSSSTSNMDDWNKPSPTTDETALHAHIGKTKKLKGAIRSQDRFRRFSSALELLSPKHLGSMSIRRNSHARQAIRPNDIEVQITRETCEERSPVFYDDVDSTKGMTSPAYSPWSIDSFSVCQHSNVTTSNGAYPREARALSLCEHLLEVNEIPQRESLWNAYDALLIKTLAHKASSDERASSERQRQSGYGFYDLPNYVSLTPPPRPSSKKRPMVDKNLNSSQNSSAKLTMDISEVLDSM